MTEDILNKEKKTNLRRTKQYKPHFSQTPLLPPGPPSSLPPPLLKISTIYRSPEVCGSIQHLPALLLVFNRTWQYYV